jgi:rod shape-determining protein MreC
MIADNHLQSFVKIRSALSIIVVPIQYLVNWPVELIDRINDYLTSQHKLLDENTQLHNEQLLLQAKIQKFITLEKENAQLRALLSSSAHINARVLAAQILAVDLNPFDQQIILDKGKREGIYLDQPILDAYGVMGQIIDVGPITSRALLITSPHIAIPIQDSRNGIRAIAIGDGYSGDMKLMYVTDTTDIKPGDLLISSGLGLKFPIGYPVGIVKTVEHHTDERFAVIKVTPSAKLNLSRQVLLVWPEKLTSP